MKTVTMTKTPYLSAEERLIFKIAQTIHLNIDGVHIRPKQDQIFFSTDAIALVQEYRDFLLEGRTKHDN